jgi:hypothetical protein
MATSYPKNFFHMNRFFKQGLAVIIICMGSNSCFQKSNCRISRYIIVAYLSTPCSAISDAGSFIDLGDPEYFS